MEINLKTRQILSDAGEAAGLLWQKGWAERNGGNISINITESICTDVRFPEPIEIKPLLREMALLAGQFFYVTGTGERMRNVSGSPLKHGLIIRINADGKSYHVVAGEALAPTSELPSHLAIHQQFIQNNRTCRVVLHTHPTELIALTHCAPFLEPGALTRMLWSMIPETRVFVPKGIGIVPYLMTGTAELAAATIRALEKHDVVAWEKHGVLAVGEDILACFDMIDTLTKSAQIYLAAKMAGFEPQGLSDSQMEDLRNAFRLP
jgi:rhamnulose-1-phosphate aldolase